MMACRSLVNFTRITYLNEVIIRLKKYCRNNEYCITRLAVHMMCGLLEAQIEHNSACLTEAVAQVEK